MRALCTIINIYTAAIFVRIILSWFPLSPGTTMSKIADGLSTVTDPVLAPIRKIMPRTGMIDLSPIIAVLLVQVLARLIFGC
jgi:YggT family protein